jgi:hypothetical protein
LVKGKRWLLLSRWVNLNTEKKRQLNQLFKLNRRVLKESLSRLWEYRSEGAMLRYLENWIDQRQWQRLLKECCYELWVGDAAQIRAIVVRQQNTDVRDAAGPSGRHSELLPDAHRDGRSGSHQWKHQVIVTPRSHI